MQTRACLTAAVLATALASCGSGVTAHPTSTTATTAPAGGSRAGVRSPSGPVPAGPNGTFVLALRATSRTAPHAPGTRSSVKARLRVLGSQGRLCWTFTRVVGVTHPTGARITIAARSPSGPGLSVGATLVALGTGYSAAGCTPVSPGIASEITSVPVDFFLVIDSDNFPNDELRAQL
ncbi:MAG: hypothetical protein QOH12_1471 [Solirubrobacteraceae bacterium]|nr:hypothetical protein [Solirubrobacteraceae bacterium]